MINILLLTGVVIAGAAGDVSVARAMRAVGEVSRFHPAALLAVAGRAGRQAYLWLGILWKAVAFFCLLALLERAELSWVVPATAVSFIVEIFAAKYFLREQVNATRWAGAVCIGLGVALISL